MLTATCAATFWVGANRNPADIAIKPSVFSIFINVPFTIPASSRCTSHSKPLTLASDSRLRDQPTDPVLVNEPVGLVGLASWSCYWLFDS